MTAFVIFNPNSAGGRTGAEWREIEEALERVFPLMSFFVTAAPGQAAHRVRDALREGHMEIIAVGGDGTINEALNGFFEHGAPVSPEAVFSFVHSGSDSALCRKFGLLPGWPAGIEHLKQARVRKADVGRVSCLTREGAPASRYFLGAASFGLSGSIARAMGGARIARFFGHRFALSWHSMMALLRWRTCRVRLIADNYDEIAGIASVRLSPYGGLFDVEIAAGDSRRHILSTMKTAARRLRSIRVTAAPTLDTAGPVAVETDGESVGMLPATFEIHPGTLNLRV
jgi:diacylglycerol kinase family enzyme